MRIAQPQKLSSKSAAIYARQSRTTDTKHDKQKKDQHVETTLDTQSTACRKFATSRGFTVSPDAVFTERYTGAEMWDRPVLSELRRRIKAREYKAVVCYSTDRLARDPVHLALILEECQRVQCELIFVTEPLEDSPEGQLILYIKGYAAKIERLRIKDRMARGRNAIIAAGKLTCQGAPVYGYQFDTTNRVRTIDPPAAAIVNDIYRWTIEGQSARSIASRLQQMKIPSPGEYLGRVLRTGRPLWNGSQVSRILKDETYTGVTYVNKHKTTEERDKATGRYKTVKLPRSEWKKLPDGLTPAIISQGTFDAAQKSVLKNYRTASAKRNELRPALLRGVLFCANCNVPMYRMTESTYKGPNCTIYKCASGRVKQGRVIGARDCKRIKAEGIEQEVWSKLVSFLIDPKLVEKEVQRALSSTPDDSLVNDLAGADKQLERSRRVRDKALEQYEECVADGDDEMAARWDAKAKEANSDVRALASVMQSLNARLAAYQHSGKTAKAFAVQCRKVMQTGEFTFEEKRAALDALNVKVFAAVGMPTRIQLDTSLVTEQKETSVKVEVCV